MKTSQPVAGQSVEMKTPAVRLTDVAKAFGQLVVLDGITAELAQGEILVLLGESGSGKSTLLRAIAGLMPPDSGRIEIGGVATIVDGKEVRSQTAEHSVGFVFQQYSLWPHMTVMQNLALAPSKVLGEDTATICERARELLAAVGLEKYETAMPSQLSGGQRQRVAIARAVMMRPRVLLCDEVTSALDPPVAHNVLQVLTRLRDRESLSSIVVTHDVAFAAKAADRIIFMQDGKIAEEIAPRNLSKPKSAGLQRFVEAVRWET